MKIILFIASALSAVINLQPYNPKSSVTHLTLDSQDYISSDTSISDLTNSVLITPNFNHNYNYEDELMILRFDYSEDIIAKKEIKKEEDLTFSIPYDLFAKAKSFRFDLLDDTKIIEGAQHVINHVDTGQQQIVLGLNGNNFTVSEPKKVLYKEGGSMVQEWFRCQFQNRNAVNQYAWLIETNINYTCDTDLVIDNLEYDYGSYQVEKLKGNLVDGKVLTGEPLSFNKIVTKGVESKLYSDSHILIDPYGINQTVTTIADFTMGKVFKKEIKVYSTSIFENPLVAHSSQAKYSFKSNETIEDEWDDEFYFGSNTIDSIIGKGVNYENIYNHKV